MKSNKIIKIIGMLTVGIFSVGVIAIPTMILSSCSTADVYEITCDVVDVYVGYESSAPLSPKLTLNGTAVTDEVSYIYTSSNVDIAEISGDGGVTGIKVGPVTITINAIINTGVVATKSIDLTVIEPFITITANNINLTQKRTEVQKASIATSVTPAGITSSVVLSTSTLVTGITFIDENDGTGTLTVEEGVSITSVQTIIITATCDDMTDTVEITVNPAESEIDIATEGDITAVTQSYQADVSLGITATVYPESITDPIDWSIKGISSKYENIIVFIHDEIDNNKASLTIKKGEEIKQDQIVTIGVSCGELTSEIEITINAFNNAEKLQYAEVEGGYSVKAADNTVISGELIIPATYNDKPVTQIAAYGFADHQKQITSVIIPENVVKIDDYAFLGCTSLTNITIPDTVTLIGVEAFRDCPLESITIDSNNPTYKKATNVGPDAIVIVSGGTELNSNCSNIAGSLVCGKLVFPDSVTSVNDNSFAGCEGITGVKFSNNLKTIGQRSFQLTGITSVIIPDTVTLIGVEAFQNCPLTSITIDPNNPTYKKATNVGPDATVIVSGGTELNGNNVVGNLALGDLVISTDVAFVNTFKDCKGITSVEYTLGEQTALNGISGCGNLISIVIPEGVTEITNFSFLSLPKLLKVTINAIIPPNIVGYASAFTNVSKDAKFYVPAGSVEAYKTHDSWSKLASQIYPIESTK